MKRITEAELDSIGNSPIVITLEGEALYSNHPEDLEGYTEVFNIDESGYLLTEGETLLDVAELSAKAGMSTVLVDRKSVYVLISEYKKFMG